MFGKKKPQRCRHHKVDFYILYSHRGIAVRCADCEQIFDAVQILVFWRQDNQKGMPIEPLDPDKFETQ